MALLSTQSVPVDSLLPDVTLTFSNLEARLRTDVVPLLVVVLVVVEVLQLFLFEE